MTATINEALELDHVESHLHPEPSYDVEAHPVPTGLEEIWRFTPLKRLRGLLDGAPSDASLSLRALRAAWAWRRRKLARWRVIAGS